MIKFEVIGGLPFYTPVRNMEEFMTVGELVEGLIYMKEKYDIGYPDDDYINLACNLLDKLPKDGNVGVLLAFETMTDIEEGKIYSQELLKEEGI